MTPLPASSVARPFVIYIRIYARVFPWGFNSLRRVSFRNNAARNAELLAGCGCDAGAGGGEVDRAGRVKAPQA